MVSFVHALCSKRTPCFLMARLSRAARHEFSAPRDQTTIVASLENSVLRGTSDDLAASFFFFSLSVFPPFSRQVDILSACQQ